MTYRKNFIQLPSIKELEEILKTEAQRPIPKEKENLHYVALEPLIKFLNFLDIDTRELNLDKTWQEVRKISEAIINEAIETISSMDKLKLSLPATLLYQYLDEEDALQKADLIFVFGAKTTARLVKAVELYKKRLAPKLFFSGGTPLYGIHSAEADYYKRLALEQGVVEDDIITENKSISVADNVRSSLNLLDQMQFKYKKLILVNSPYSQRRGYGMMMKYVPSGTILLRVNSATREGLRENDWFTNEEGIRYVFSEYYKIWFGLVINTT